VRFAGDVGGLGTEQNVSSEGMSCAKLVLNLDIHPADQQLPIWPISLDLSCPSIEMVVDFVILSRSASRAFLTEFKRPSVNPS
jgi:hypothetical protein